MGFSFVSWIVMMSIFVLSVRFFSSCIFVVSPLMFICIIVITIAIVIFLIAMILTNGQPVDARKCQFYELLCILTGPGDTYVVRCVFKKQWREVILVMTAHYSIRCCSCTSGQMFIVAQFGMAPVVVFF